MADKYLLNNVFLKTSGLIYEPGDLISDTALQSELVASGGKLLDVTRALTDAADLVTSLFKKGQRTSQAVDIMNDAAISDVKDDISNAVEDISVIQAAIQTFQEEGTSATIVGTPDNQTGAEASFVIYGTTTNATTLVLDTGYAPPDGHSAHIDGGLNIVDRTAEKTSSKGISASIKNFSGAAVAGTPIVSGTNGDSTLSTATIVFSIVSGTVNVTLTPPVAYTGTLEWIISIDVLEN